MELRSGVGCEDKTFEISDQVLACVCLGMEAMKGKCTCACSPVVQTHRGLVGNQGIHCVEVISGLHSLIPY